MWIYPMLRPVVNTPNLHMTNKTENLKDQENSLLKKKASFNKLLFFFTTSTFFV